MSRNKQMTVESRIIYTHTYTHMYVCVCVLSCFSCPTLCELRENSLPGSSVYGIFQARILECVAMPSCRGSSQPRNQTLISCIAGRFFTAEPPEKSNIYIYICMYYNMIPLCVSLNA